MSAVHRVRLLAGLAPAFVWVLGTSAVGAEELSPPLLQIGPLDSAVVDGRVGEDEWLTAATVNVFVGDDGAPMDVGAACRIGYDATDLLLCWRIDGVPAAERRGRDGSVWLDDSIEVRLRPTDDDPELRFAISAAGDLYDARDGDASWDCPWRALVIVGRDCWQGEARIPFACLGAGAPATGDAWRANLLVNAAAPEIATASWSPPPVPGFWVFGRAPSPIGLSDLAVSADTARVTPCIQPGASLRATLFEGDAEVETREITAAETVEIELPRPGRFRLRLAGTDVGGELVLQREMPLFRPPPLAITAQRRLLGRREVMVSIDGRGLESPPEVYRVSAEGLTAVELRPGPGASRSASATIDLSEFEAGEVVLTISALAGDGELASETVTLRLPQPPAWAGNSLGRHARLPEPWTPVIAEGQQVRCWGRVYDFGDRPLPVRVTANGRELLARPVRLRSSVGGVSQQWTECQLRWLEITQTHAVAAITAEAPSAELRIRATCHYDGLMVLETRINPRGNQRVDGVSLEIPVAAESAGLMQVADGTAEGLFRGATPGSDWSREFAPAVWIGSHERGLQWLCDSAEGWRLEAPAEALRMSRGQDTARLVVTMVDRPLLPGVGFETRFALQATPVRPMVEDWRKRRIASATPDWLASCRTEGAGPIEALAGQGVTAVVVDDDRYRPRPHGMDQQVVAELRAIVDACHAAGLEVLLAADAELDGDPAWEAYRDEVAVVPGDGPDTARPAMGCPAGAWADYLVAAVAETLDACDADGVYLRDLSMPQCCASELHGCGYESDEGRRATWDVMAARELVGRLRSVVRARRPDGLLVMEAEKGTLAPAVAFADRLVTSAADRAGELLTPDEFHAGAPARSLGLPCDVMVPAEGGRLMRNAVSMALLHDAGLQPVAGSVAVAMAAAIWNGRGQFGVDRSGWYPFWRAEGMVGADRPGALVSAHARRGEVLAAVANRSDEEQIFELSLDRNALHLGPWLEATDLLTGRRVPQVGDVLRLRPEPRQPALVLIRTRTLPEDGEDDG